MSVLGRDAAPATLQLVAEIHNWVGSVTFFNKSPVADANKNVTNQERDQRDQPDQDWEQQYQERGRAAVKDQGAGQAHDEARNLEAHVCP